MVVITFSNLLIIKIFRNEGILTSSFLGIIIES